jgi:parvulin-like peptidyl-prolyl isomerase
MPAKPTTTTSTRPTTTSAPTVVITIGKQKIMSDEIERAMERPRMQLPPERLAQVREGIIRGIVQRELMKSYLESVSIPEEELQAEKQDWDTKLKENNKSLDQLIGQQGLDEQMLRVELKYRVLMKKASSKEKIDAFIKESPVSFFDGTKVKASHILLLCDFFAPPAKHAAVKAKLEKIGKEIESGQISFAEAAKKYSEAPDSAPEGGDLGTFTLDRMILPFAKAASTLQVGQTSGIIHVLGGYQFIKVTERTEGDGKVSERAEDIARRMLIPEWRNQSLLKTLETSPVKVLE